MTKPGVRRRRSAVRIALGVIGALVVAFVLIQVIQYGRDHSNPPAGQQLGRGADRDPARRAPGSEERP